VRKARAGWPSETAQNRSGTLSPDDVSAVLVTRGETDLSTILESLPFKDVVIWDNSKREDFQVYGRFAAIAEAKNDIIYVQDDDCVVTCIGALLAAYTPGIITLNMPAKRLDLGFKHLPNARSPVAMFLQPSNYEERDEALARARRIRDGASRT
jgi:hypothetical protein